MLCNITQNSMGQTRGVPSQVRTGGTQPGPARGGTLPGPNRKEGYPDQGTPPGRVPPQAGYLPRQGTPPAGYPPSQVQMGGGTQLGQRKEYSLHGGRYACCVHAGGLSCLFMLPIFSQQQLLEKNSQNILISWKKTGFIELPSDELAQFCGI